MANTADALNGLFNVDIQDSEGNVLYQAPQDFDTETDAVDWANTELETSGNPDVAKAEVYRLVKIDDCHMGTKTVRIVEKG